MEHPNILHLTHRDAKTGAYLIPCFGCGNPFPYNGNICMSPGCLETWLGKVAEYNGQSGSSAPKDVPMPPLEPPASAKVVEMPKDSKANFDLE